MSAPWFVFRCPRCSRSVSLPAEDAEARCGRCGVTLELVGPLPADFHEAV